MRAQPAMGNRLITLCRTAVAGGLELLSFFPPDSSVSRSKQDGSPVTNADMASQKVMCDLLDEALPDIPLVSEEDSQPSPVVRRRWDEFILLDPLDGTKEFLRGVGEFTVNVALVRSERPVLGVIYNPTEDVLYVAKRQIGAYRIVRASMYDFQRAGEGQINGGFESLTVHKHTSRSALKIVVSRSHRRPETEQYIERIRRTGVEVEVILLGSALKFCMVAEGSADMYIRYVPSMEWDTAAGDLIVEEAGGRVRAVDGNQPLQYNKEDLRNPGFIAEARRE